METAKVDIQKLQLLNDRIAQCFDALNQVRLSVHGLSHTGIGQQGFGQQGFGAIGQGFMGVSPYQQNPYQQNPYQQTTFQSPYQQNPYLSAGIGQSPWANPLGLSHSNPFTVSPYGFSPLTQGINPLTQGINPLTQGIGAFGAMSVDPYLAVKVAQTFPFAQLPISPVGI